MKKGLITALAAISLGGCESVGPPLPCEAPVVNAREADGCDVSVECGDEGRFSVICRTDGDGSLNCECAVTRSREPPEQRSFAQAGFCDEVRGDAGIAALDDACGWRVGANLAR